MCVREKERERKRGAEREMLRRVRRFSFGHAVAAAALSTFPFAFQVVFLPQSHRAAAEAVAIEDKCSERKAKYIAKHNGKKQELLPSYLKSD